MGRVAVCEECGSVHWSSQPHTISTQTKTFIRNGDGQSVTLQSDDDVTIPKQRRWELKNKEKYLAWRREYMRDYRKNLKKK